MGTLDGKVAIIVGGTSGIGARTAELFVEEGATVVVAGRRRDVGEALVRKLGASASFVQTDVVREQELKALISGTDARFGRIDCLFNNAGYGVPQRSIVDFDLGEDRADGSVDAVVVQHVDQRLLKHVANAPLGLGHAYIHRHRRQLARRLGHAEQDVAHHRTVAMRQDHLEAGLNDLDQMLAGLSHQ